jgi:hypothetical protein
VLLHVLCCPPALLLRGPRRGCWLLLLTLPAIMKGPPLDTYQLRERSHMHTLKLKHQGPKHRLRLVVAHQRWDSYSVNLC